MDLKVCSKCGEEKPRSEFYIEKSGRVMSACKKCNARKVLAWRRANRDKDRAYSMRWRRDNPEKALAKSRRWSAKHARRYNLEKNYGLTVLEVERMLAAQGGRCAICGTTDWRGRNRNPMVDHDHTTGAVRGLLCHMCNFGLGSFRDSSELLEAAAAYLSAPRLRRVK